MIFNINSPSIAVVTLATLSSIYDVHVGAFTPSLLNTQTKFTSNVSGGTRSTETSYPYQSLDNSKNRHVGRRYLSSSVVPEIKFEEDQSTKEKNNLTENDANQESKVIATAVAKSFIPSPNGFSGVMAIKLMEEDGASSAIALGNGSDDNNSLPKVEGDKVLLSQTGMFGGNTKKKFSSRSTQGECFAFFVVAFNESVLLFISISKRFLHSL